MGKLQYFTNLNSWAIKGDDFPQSNQSNQYSIQNYISTIYFHEISWASFNVVSASMAYAKKHPPNPRDFTEAKKW